MKSRYNVQRARGFEATDVYHVVDTQDTSNPYGPPGPIDVWVSDGLVMCTVCSGPLQAMLSSCPHARAVKRYIKKHARREGKAEKP